MKNTRLGALAQNMRWLMTSFLVGVLATAGLVYCADREMRNDLLVQSNLVACAVDVKRVKALSGTRADLESPDYRHLQEQLASVRAANPKCRFVYLMGRKADGTVFFFLDAQDDSRESTPPSQPGDVYEDSTPELIASFSNGIPFVEGPVSDQWGMVVSALVPLLDPQTGRPVAVLGMDIDARDWRWNVSARAALPVALVLLVLIGLVVLACSGSVSSSPKPVLKRLLPGLMILLVVLFVIAETLLWRMHREVLHERTEVMTAAVMKDLHLAIAEQTHGLTAAVDAIVAPHHRLHQALKSRDSARLQADWRSLFENLQREKILTHFYFADANRRCLVRLDELKRFGDSIDQFTIREAERTGKTVSGVEMCLQGQLILRMVKPVFDGPTLLGYVGVGKSIESILKTIQNIHPRVQFAIVIRKNLLDRTAWEAGMQMLGREADWDRMPGSVVVWASQRRVPDRLADFADRFPESRAVPGAIDREIADGGKVWHATISSLKASSGREAGDVLVMDDITPLKGIFIRDMVVSVVFGGILLAMLSAMVFVLLRRTDAALSAQQAKLRESEKLLSRAEEIAQTGSWELDPATRRFTWSEGHYRVYGCTRNELPVSYEDFLEFVHPDDRAEVQKVYSRSLRNGSSGYEVEHRIVLRGTGEVRTVYERCIHERDGTGTVIHSTGTVQDITERKSAEEKIRQSEEKFRSLFDSMTEIVALHELVFDEHGNPVDYRIIDCNPAFTKITGIKAEQVIGRLATEAYKTETAPYLREYAHVALTREIKTLSVYFAPMDRNFEIKVFSPKKNFFATVTSDITEGKRVETYREMVRAILQILNEPGDLQESVQQILGVMKTRTEVDAVGLRLQVGEDFPYFAQHGFSEDFVRAENTLLHLGKEGCICRDPDGTACLECTCGLIISGKTDPSSPLFTQGGSFWTNDSFVLLDLPSDQDPRMHPRNNCMREGYASIALIPIRTTDRIVGLLQFNDKRKGRFNLETIELLEGVAAHIGSALMRKWSEKALQESETRFKALHNASFGGITIHDKGLILDCNRGLSEITGYSLEELIGMDGLLLISEQSRSLVRGNIAAGYEKPYEAIGLRKNGEEYPLRLEGRNIPYKGKMVRAVEFRDITEQKRAEADQKSLQAQLIVSQKMESVGRLAGGVAHDFNNMLQAILGYTELAIGQVPPGGQVHDDLEAIKKAAQHSARLTQQLLAFARRQVVAPKVIDLNDTIAAMLKILRPLLGEDIDLVWRPGTDVWPVKMDPVQVDQVLANLCVNARDAIAGVGRITLETSTASFDDAGCTLRVGFVPGDYVLLAVSDTGCGMDAEVRSHIFEPFFSTKEFGKGTGLGLATVYGAVQQNRGFVNVYSEPGQGSTFKIYLPRHVAQATSATAEEIEHPPVEAMRGSETILLVEDELVILNATRKMLERMGYAVLAAETPEEALRLAAENAGRIHLVMTDVVIPRMNGRDLVNALVSLYPGLKCLFMSGYTADVIAHQGVLDEGVHFLQKPFSTVKLGAILREVLEG